MLEKGKEKTLRESVVGLCKKTFVLTLSACTIKKENPGLFSMSASRVYNV